MSFDRFWRLLDEIDETKLWGFVISVLLIISIIADIFFPPIEKIINDHIGFLLLTVLIIFIRVLIINFNFFKKQLKRNSGVYICKNRSIYYKMIFKEMRKAKKGTNILVTNFEQIDIPYDVHNVYDKTFKWEKKLMKLWKKRVQNGDFNVMQIVGIWSESTLKDMIDRIETFKNCGNYSLSIKKLESPSFSIISQFIFDDYLALLEFPANPRTPSIGDHAIISRDKNFIELNKIFFNVLWSNSDIIKASDGIKHHKLIEIQNFVKTQPIIMNIKNQLEEVNKINPRSDFLKKIADDIIAECICTLDSFNRGILIISPDNFKLLFRINEGTKQEILCTSYLHNKEFWESENGKKLLEINKVLIDKGVKIKRIFILTKNELDDKLIIQILNNQYLQGIEVWISDESLINNNLKIDFSINDESIVFEQIINTEGILIHNTILTNKSEINIFKEKYNTIMKKSKQFKSTDEKIKNG